MEHPEAEGCYLLVKKTIIATDLRSCTDAVTVSHLGERMHVCNWEHSRPGNLGGMQWVQPDGPPAHSSDRKMPYSWETAGPPLSQTRQGHLDD